MNQVQVHHNILNGKAVKTVNIKKENVTAFLLILIVELGLMLGQVRVILEQVV